MTQLRAAIALIGALTISAPAAADEWPSRPVRMVNTFAAGGTADVLTRLVADQLSATFKQQFFVETRAGAAGTIGVKSVVDSPPDGYNFALTNITHLVLAPISNPKLGYDPKRDLTNIGYVAGSPIMISVNAGSSIKTLADFIEQGRTKALSYSSSGVGSSGQLVAEDFAKKAGLKIEHVPYKGASQGLTDLIGGHIVFSAQTVSSTAAMVRGGQLRAIAHSNATRMPDFADVPTFKEAGYDVVATTWFTISGPAQLPKDLTDKVNREIARAVANPEVQQRLRQDGLIAQTMSPEELSRYIDAETARWRPVLDQLGLIGK
ncbi:MAG: tripartite tricarboxylate transporter substrate binding protein [Hyphomicrobiales bacterium]|nr:tripartite tricarboxylate transporter substrate binding protein [Alphaproteobacteria bacterium]